MKMYHHSVMFYLNKKQKLSLAKNVSSNMESVAYSQMSPLNYRSVNYIFILDIDWFHLFRATIRKQPNKERFS